jgi:predicted enzyme related to lactoylglutathione lyase
MPRVIHFEIHAEQPERALQFYTSLFGWKFQKWEGPMPYWLITTGAPGSPGIDGGMILRQGPAPAEKQAVNAYVCTIDTPNLDTFTTQAEKLGGKIVVPKMPIPGVGWLAYATDTEGNIFGMMQNDPSAK